MKRTSGEGTWRERGDRYQWVLTVDGTRLSASGATKDECRRVMQEKIKRLRSGKPQSDSSQRLDEYIEDWLRVSIEPYKSPNTLIQYRGLMRNHVLPVLGSVRLDRLKRQQIDALWASLSKKLAPRTVG